VARLGAYPITDHMRNAVPKFTTPVIALFDASNDTVEMVRRMLDASGLGCLVGCHVSDLKKGALDFARYLDAHEPDVVILDISPPYRANWDFIKTLRESRAMEGRGVVLTTTNRKRLNEATGADSEPFDIVGKPYNLEQIKTALQTALERARSVKRSAPR
jgi:DNA-binding response OmpR family regulator